MRGIVFQPLPVCVYVCAHTQAHTREGRSRQGWQGAHRGLCSSPDRGSGAWFAPPSRKLACTSDGFHGKPQCTHVSHRAPTPEHTQHGSVPQGPNTRPQRQDSVTARPSPRGVSLGLPSAGLPGRGLRPLERFSNLHGTLSPLFSCQRTRGYPTLPPRVPRILMKTQQRAGKGEAAGNLHEALGLVFI